MTIVWGLPEESPSFLYLKAVFAARPPKDKSVFYIHHLPFLKAQFAVTHSSVSLIFCYILVVTPLVA